MAEKPSRWCTDDHLPRRKILEYYESMYTIANGLLQFQERQKVTKRGIHSIATVKFRKSCWDNSSSKNQKAATAQFYWLTKGPWSNT